MANESSHPGGRLILILVLLVGFGALVAAAGGAFYLFARDKLPLGQNQERESDGEVATRPPSLSPPPSGPIPINQLGSLTSAVARSRSAASAPIQATARSYPGYLERDDVLVLVDYYADWCAPCRGIAPSLSRLAAAHGDKVVVLKVNIDREKGLASAAGVRSIPDVRLLHRGQQLERVVGGYPYAHYEGLVLKHRARLPQPAPTAPPPEARPSPSRPAQPGGSITPLEEDWLPPGVQPASP